MTTEAASGDAASVAAPSQPVENGFDVMTATDPGAPIEEVQDDDDQVEATADDTDLTDEDDSETLEASGEDDESEDGSDGEQDEGDEDEEASQDEEWVEVDIDGVKETIPARLKDAFLKNRDYTQKTQQVAEQRKQVETFAQELQQRAKALEQKETQVRQLSEQDIALQTELGQVNAQIAAMEQQAAEIEALASNPDQNAQLEYLKNVQRYEQLKARRGQLGQQWNQRQQQAQTQRQAEISRRQTYTWGWATENIEGFGTERWNQMKDLAKGFGINERALAENIGPAEIKLLDLALRGHELQVAKTNPPKTKPKLPKSFKPAKGVKGKGNPRPTPRLDSMDMKEYLAAREKS